MDEYIQHLENKKTLSVNNNFTVCNLRLQAFIDSFGVFEAELLFTLSKESSNNLILCEVTLLLLEFHETVCSDPDILTATFFLDKQGPPNIIIKHKNPIIDIKK